MIAQIFIAVPGYQSTAYIKDNPDSKVHGANMGPIWGRQDPGGPHVGPMNFAIWELIQVDRIMFCRNEILQW